MLLSTTDNVNVEQIIAIAYHMNAQTTTAVRSGRSILVLILSRYLRRSSIVLGICGRKGSLLVDFLMAAVEHCFYVSRLRCLDIQSELFPCRGCRLNLILVVHLLRMLHV